MLPLLIDGDEASVNGDVKDDPKPHIESFIYWDRFTCIVNELRHIHFFAFLLYLKLVNDEYELNVYLFGGIYLFVGIIVWVYAVSCPDYNTWCSYRVLIFLCTVFQPVWIFYIYSNYSTRHKFYFQLLINVIFNAIPIFIAFISYPINNTLDAIFVYSYYIL